MNFALLHQQPNPLLIANVWDVPGVHAAQAAGYDALGTSSAAISAMLGYSDGEGISFAELKQIIVRLQTAAQLPLSVDMESGYAQRPEDVAANLIELAGLGVVGVNIEDSVVNLGKRTLVEAPRFAAKLKVIRQLLKEQDVELFINVRTDPFLLGVENALNESIMRGKMYQDHGAEGLFVPCVTLDADIAALVEAVDIPVNVMCMPSLPGFETLKQLGVKRISMGNFVHTQSQHHLQRTMKNIITEQSFDPVFHHDYNR